MEPVRRWSGFPPAFTPLPAFTGLFLLRRLHPILQGGRLSRSIRDFGRIMEILEKHGATFVSVTQQFNTAASPAASR